MGDPSTMESIQKQIDIMAEKSDKRMDRLEELITKLGSASSNVNESPSLDENGKPISPSKENEVDSLKDRNPNQFGYAYNIAPNVQHPHVNNLDNPPLVDRTRFTNWKASMKSYVCSSSMQIWRIIEKGYYPKDVNNLSSSEIIDEQLNAHAMHMLEKAMVNEGVEHIRSLPNAKEAWDYLLAMYDGNMSMKRSKKSLLQRQVDHFIMKDEELPEDVYRTLKALMVDMMKEHFLNLFSFVY